MEILLEYKSVSSIEMLPGTGQRPQHRNTEMVQAEARITEILLGGTAGARSKEILVGYRPEPAVQKYCYGTG
jgi:hypothetical protein